MKYAKKMMLVPFVKNSNTPPTETKLIELDDQMNEILKDKSSKVDEKVKLYQQVLSKYIRHYDPNNAGLAPATVEMFKKLTKFLDKPDSEPAPTDTVSEVESTNPPTTRDLSYTSLFGLNQQDRDPGYIRPTNFYHPTNDLGYIRPRDFYQTGLQNIQQSSPRFDWNSPKNQNDANKKVGLHNSRISKLIEVDNQIQTEKANSTPLGKLMHSLNKEKAPSALKTISKIAKTPIHSVISAIQPKRASKTKKIEDPFKATRKLARSPINRSRHDQAKEYLDSSASNNSGVYKQTRLNNIATHAEGLEPKQYARRKQNTGQGGSGLWLRKCFF